jgi:hypothetical protein
MAELTREQLEDLIAAAETKLAEMDGEDPEARADDLWDRPIKSEPAPDPDGQLDFFLRWAGVSKEKREARQIHTFADGTRFLAYPLGMAKDWDVVRRGQKDATGELNRKYNFPSGKPAWNALDWDRHASEEVKMQRIRDYQGGLRQPLNTWPEAYRKVYEETH